MFRAEWFAAHPHLGSAETPISELNAEAREHFLPAMRAHLATLDYALDSRMQFRRGSGELSDDFVRWHLLVQMVLHGAQHRSEAAALLTACGESPGDLEFIFFVLRHR